MADMTRAEAARLEKKASAFEMSKARARQMTRGWGNLAMLEGSAFLTGYARGRVGDGDKLQIGSFPLPLDVLAAGMGLALGLRKGKGAAAATAVGAGALASFLSHEGNKIGQRAKSRGNIIGQVAYPGLGIGGPQGLIGQQYNIVGQAGTGMGQGAVSNYARNAW